MDEVRVPAEGTFDGAIFDCDGTLADTMPLHYQSWCETLAPRGGVMSEALFYELGGVASTEIVRILNARDGYCLHIEETAAEKEARYVQLLPQAPPVAPVVALVREWAARYPLAVASGGIRPLVETTLTGLGIRDLFRAIITAEDVRRGKPDPEIFLLAAERLSVMPARCVVFEDSDLGLEGARRAGMTAVDVRPWVIWGRGEVARPR
jgi:HAD superfamily hydrolase (TIGR01509 family)